MQSRYVYYAVIIGLLSTLFAGREIEAESDALSSDDSSIVEPHLVHADGSFLSHNVKLSNAFQRQKRDLGHVDDSSKRIFIKIKLNDEDAVLNLTANDKLITPHFLVEKIHFEDENVSPESAKFGSDLMSSILTNRQPPCHYHGNVVGESGSKVAVSTCHGVTGLIRTKSGEYFIEPHDEDANLAYINREDSILIEPSKPQKHKIYRRDVSSRNKEKKLKDSSSKKKRSTEKDEDEEFCGVADSRSRYNKSLRNRQLWEFARERRSTTRKMRRSRTRQRRSVSTERFIETMVVVDKKMIDHYSQHGQEYLETYVLTIMNMVSNLFKDSSIGNSLHVSVVRLVLLTGEEKGLKISQHAEKTLDSFCKWARKMNPGDDSHPQHHDVAVLLTRHDICSNYNQSCETLGLAHVAGMCQWHRSCNVNQDTGLSLAYTVAHEMGHNFAMHHDGQSNECMPNSRHPTVMAPHLTSNNKVMRWSSCSRNYITKFLDRNWGFCLSDEPVHNDNYTFPVELPGTIYDVNHQCRLMFGEKSRHCYGIDDVCNRLWCSSRGTCKSRLHSAAPGTPCGRDKVSW